MASSSTTSARPEWEPEDICTAGCLPENEIMSDFHEIAPSTASTSSTLIQKPCFDVFINHRGPDVKKTLASRIYKILSDMKVTAFLDSEQLEYGDFLPTTLEAAIRGATLHIAIFSKSYAESVWCLAELSCMLKSGAKIVPIFYYVEPNDLRYVAQRKGIYADVFERHKKKRRYSAEKLREWESALHKVSFYSGEIIRNNDDEMRLLKNIVNVVLKEISNVPLLVAKHPVGLSKVVEDFEKTVQLNQGEQSVQIVGIWGMGGSGKTTLAKELYNKRCSFMEKSSFIFDIRESKGMLQKKQSELLKGLGVDVQFDNVEQGKAVLARHLRRFKMLIVMDDVDHADQLDALLPVKERLGRGTLIIVTTRELEVLTSWNISSVYKMRALDPCSAEKLFCWHAFLQPSPLYGFEVLVKRFLEACHGLPLSLKVFGAQLHQNFCKQYWESLLHKLSRILPRDIKETLKISFDALDDEEKEAFLDIACFFIGRETSLVIEVWDGCGWSGLYTWKRLLNKCLVELDNYNCIGMHDHLRDLGWEIANLHLPSRLWLSQQIINYDKQTEKRNGIRGIKAVGIGIEEWWSYRDSSQILRTNIRGELSLLTRSLVGLKLLVIRGDYFDQVMGGASRELVWLSWSDIGQRNLPAWLQLKNLRALELFENWASRLEELWETESNAPLQLRELNISNCNKFQRLPNSIGCVNELKKVVIRGRNNVRSLPEEFCRLQLLEHLELPFCEMLSSLPDNFGDLRSLRYLNLSSCKNLKRLPISFKNLMLLHYLNLMGCKELVLMLDDFQNITELEFLKLSECERLEMLPHHITNQTSLKELYLLGVKSLRELPLKFGDLGKLQKMEIGNLLGPLRHLFPPTKGPNLKSLPNSLGNLSSLLNLSIENCPNLESLPISFGNLSSLTDLAISNCPNLKLLPTSFGNMSSLTDLLIENCLSLESLTASLGDLFSLTNLSINNCPKLECLPSSFSRLNLLEHLELSWCPISQVDFGAASFAFSNLKRMELKGTKVGKISISEDLYPHLARLELDNNYHLTEIEAFPENLEWLHIKLCPRLAVLPSFRGLTSLREFEVQRCNRIEKIEGLKYCTRLEMLTLYTCWEVLHIESLEQMQKLRRVELRANKGSVFESCFHSIQNLQNWPDELIICTRAVPDASSLVDSLLSSNSSVVDSFSSKDPWSRPKLLCKRFSNRNALMLCYVISSIVSLQMKIDLECCDKTISGEDEENAAVCSMGIDEGTWALIFVFTQRSQWLRTYDLSKYAFSISANENRGRWAVDVERGLAVRGEEQKLLEAFCHLIY